jgi:hypothetical protein
MKKITIIEIYLLPAKFNLLKYNEMEISLEYLPILSIFKAEFG